MSDICVDFIDRHYIDAEQIPPFGRNDSIISFRERGKEKGATMKYPGCLT